MGRETLAFTLKSLERQTRSPDEVLVINQGPTDLEHRMQFDVPTKFLNQDVRGLSRARNRALEAFQGDWILFTDDDQEVNAEWVEQLETLATLYPEADMIGGVVFPPPRYNNEEEFVSQMYVSGEVLITAANYLAPMGSDGALCDIWGGNFALSRRCIETVGRYDESFGRGSGVFDMGEDTDYTMRFFSAGLTGLLSCRLIIYHTYGGRPYSDQMQADNVTTAAGLTWKSIKRPDLVRPDLAARMLPFGRRRLMAAKATFGRVFSADLARSAMFQAILDKLDREFDMDGPYLKRVREAGP